MLLLPSCSLETGGLGSGGGTVGSSTSDGPFPGTTSAEGTSSGDATSSTGTVDTTAEGSGSGSSSGDTGEEPLPPPPPYVDIRPVSVLNDPSADEDDPTLRRDQLEIIFASDRRGSQNLYRAVRASVNEDFSEPLPLGSGINTPDEETTPELSSDGELLLFARNGGAQGFEIYYTTRSSAMSTSWASPLLLTDLSSPGIESAATPQADGITLLWCSDRRRVGSGLDIWRGILDQAAVTVMTEGLVAELSSDALDCPGNSSDDMTWLLLESQREGTTGGSDIWMAQRRADGAGYWPPFNVAELNTAGFDGDPWVTEDLSTLYFATDRDGSMDIYVATTR